MPTGLLLYGAVLMLGRLPEDVLGQDARVRAGRAEERRQIAGITPLEVIDDGELVRLVDLRDEVPAVAAHLVVRRVVHHVGREHDVVGVERRAVRPLHAAPQVPRDREAVLADPAVRFGRNLGRELRRRLVVRVVAHQVRHRELVEVAADQRRRQVRVQVVEVLDVADPQRVRDRVAVVRAGGRAGDAAGRRRHLVGLRARREQHARRDGRQSSFHRYAPSRCRRRRDRRTRSRGWAESRGDRR